MEIGCGQCAKCSLCLSYSPVKYVIYLTSENKVWYYVICDWLSKTHTFLKFHFIASLKAKVSLLFWSYVLTYRSPVLSFLSHLQVADVRVVFFICNTVMD